MSHSLRYTRRDSDAVGACGLLLLRCCAQAHLYNRKAKPTLKNSKYFFLQKWVDYPSVVCDDLSTNPPLTICPAMFQILDYRVRAPGSMSCKVGRSHTPEYLFISTVIFGGGGVLSFQVITTPEGLGC